MSEEEVAARPRGDAGRGPHACTTAGVAEVLLTLGGDGALLSTRRRRVWSAQPPQITVRSTVGAGDCSLAGYLLADLAGAPPAERLRTAVAYGAASASLPGSAVPTPAQVDVAAVRVTAGAPGRTAPAPHRPRPGRRPGRPLSLRERYSMPALITTDLVALDADLGADKSAVVRRLAELVAAAGRATGADALHADAMAREAQAPTGLPGGIAIPHCRSAAVTQASLGFARLYPKVDFGAPGRPRRPRLPHRRPGRTATPTTSPC